MSSEDQLRIQQCCKFVSLVRVCIICLNQGVFLNDVVYTCVGAFLFTSLESANMSHLLTSSHSPSQYRASLSRHEGVIATRDRHPSSSSSMNTAPSSIEERIEIMVFWALTSYDIQRQINSRPLTTCKKSPTFGEQSAKPLRRAERFTRKSVFQGMCFSGKRDDEVNSKQRARTGRSGF